MKIKVDETHFWHFLEKAIWILYLLNNLFNDTKTLSMCFFIDQPVWNMYNCSMAWLKIDGKLDFHTWKKWGSEEFNLHFHFNIVFRKRSTSLKNKYLNITMKTKDNIML